MENKCNCCGEEFDEPYELEDEERGDIGDFVCPFCGSVDWDTNNE